MNSKIEWTESTWNPLVGCTRVSAGCQNCYAEKMAKRLAAMAQADIDKGRNPGRKRHYLNVLDSNGRWNGTVNLVEEALAAPLRRKKPTVYFVNSMSDLFHESVPFEFVDRVFAVMALCPQHTFQVLTKRPERMAEYLSDESLRAVNRVLVRNREDSISLAIWRMRGEESPEEIAWPLSNVWLGTSVEDQKAADERIPHLLRCPAAVRWLSCEPLLGPVNAGWAMEAFHNTSNGRDLPRINWLAVGGESGPGARPMHPDWARSLRDKCVTAGAPFFFKQWGAWRPCMSDDIEQRKTIHRWGDDAGTWCAKVGKKTAGRLLDGRTWDEYPTPQAKQDERLEVQPSPRRCPPP